MSCCYLALGDSYTIGEGVAPGERWPERLALRLRARGLAVAPPRILATTGWKIDELAAGLDRAALRPRWSLVSLLIGVNDQYDRVAREPFRRAYAAILARALALAGGRPERVFAVSIPDWSRTPFAAADARSRREIAREIDACNAAERALARRRGVTWIDVTALSRHAGPGWLVADGLHPSAAQYRAWVDVLAEPVSSLVAATGDA